MFASEYVKVDFFKIMLDGIPPTQTATVLAPYLPDGAHKPGYKGYLTQPADEFTRDLVQLDADGFTVKVHATGDRSVRVVLDAVEAARKANGDSGAQVIYGSDWPAAVPSPNPWPGIEAMDLPGVLEIFTINGAQAMNSADLSGSIEVGKSADFIVLDRNLFEVPAADISEVQILRTVSRGRTVYTPE